MKTIALLKPSANGSVDSGIKEKLNRLRYNAVFNYSMLILLGAATGALSLLLAASYYGLPVFWAYFGSPLVLLLNLLPAALLIVLAFFISGRAWISYSVPALLTLILSAIGFFKIQVRGDPFIAPDMALIVETRNIMSAYKLTTNWKIFFVFAVFIVFVAFSVFALRYKVKRPVVRVTGAIASISLAVVLFFFVYLNTDVYRLSGGAFEAPPWVFADVFISKGFVYPFLHSAKRAEPDILDDLESNPEDDLEVLVKTLVPAVIPDDKKMNVISVMLESYADISAFGKVEFLSDVYGPLHRLQNESVYGEIVTNIFGGGTIDSERLFLTGFTKLENITGDTESFVRYLRDQGFYTEGLHVGDGWFYDRVEVNNRIGFDEYYYLEDFDEGDRSDEFFFNTVREMYESREIGVPYFNYSLSYQNHGAYASDWTEEPYLITQNGMSDEAFNILNNYLRGIDDTNRRLEMFIDSFRDDPEPVIIVVFGDHKPWLGNYDFVYHELGININLGTEEGFYNFYTAPYIIWANDAAKEISGNGFTGEGGSMSPCFLMDKVFELCSWEGDEYMQALRRLRQHIDVINTPTGLYRADGELMLELTGKPKRYWDSFRKLEYKRQYNYVTEVRDGKS